MARTPKPAAARPDRAESDDDEQAETELEVGPDGPAPVDPLAPGKSLFDDGEDAVEPNEPA
jgi:hypothetical protein